MKLIRVLFFALFLLLSFQIFAADVPATKPTDAQIAQWVKDLGAEDFETRCNAEKSLITAGAPAVEPVTAALKSKDAEVAERSKRILGELQWLVRPDITNLAAIVPADSFFLLQSPSVKGFVDTARKQTALGKFYDSPEMASVKTAVAGFIIEINHMSEDAQKTASSWVDTFGGPFGEAFMRMRENNDGPPFLAAMHGISAEDKAKTYAVFSERFPLHIWGEGKIEQERYKGVSISFPTSSNYEAQALVKNIIFCGSGTDALKLLIDGVTDDKKEHLDTAPNYVQGLQKIGANPFASLYLDIETLLKMTNKHSPRDAQLFKSLGFDSVKFGMVGLYTKEDLFTERLFFKVDGERKGLAKLLSFASTTGTQAALCPPDAMAFLSLPLNGKTAFDQILNMVAEVDGKTREQLEPELAKAETALGAKISDLVAGIEGDAALWVTKPTVAAFAPPDLTAVLTLKDAAAAKKISDAMTTFTTIAEIVNKCGHADYKGRKLQWLKKEELRGPYDFAVCVDGTRLMLGSNPETLKQLIDRIDSKAAGLDSTADYKRLQALLKPEERGAMMYTNNAETYGWLYTYGIPMLITMFPEDKIGVLATLPKDGFALFKNLPGTLLSVVGTTDGVQAVSFGGMPVSGTFVSTMIPIAAFSFGGSRGPRRVKAIAVPAPAQVAP